MEEQIIYDSVGMPVFGVYCYECGKRKECFEHKGYYLCLECIKKLKENNK